jgi:hypothetical protein
MPIDALVPIATVRLAGEKVMGTVTCMGASVLEGACAVIVALPAPVAVTTPDDDTVATVASLEVNVTPLVTPPAVSAMVAPGAMVAVDGETVRETETPDPTTTCVESFIVPERTVTNVVPLDTPRTIPVLLTDATLGLRLENCGTIERRQGYIPTPAMLIAASPPTATESGARAASVTADDASDGCSAGALPSASVGETRLSVVFTQAKALPSDRTAASCVQRKRSFVASIVPLVLMIASAARQAWQARPCGGLAAKQRWHMPLLPN